MDSDLVTQLTPVSIPNLPPLILTPTPNKNYLCRRGSNTVLLLADEAVHWLQDQAKGQGHFGSQLVKLLSDTWALDVANTAVSEAIHFRERATSQYTDASYELNLACNYNCAHCYLDERKNRKLDIPDRTKLLSTMCEAGVIRLHMTGGEPLLDRYFADTYILAHKLGLMVRISTNGYALGNDRVLRLLTALRPTRIAISLYGATSTSYEAFTRTQGTFQPFMRGLEAAAQHGLPVRLKIMLSKHNESELSEMKSLAERLGFEHHVYGRLATTHKGNGNVLQYQASIVNLRRPSAPFKGCSAGKTFFHADPLGRGTICMTGRDLGIDLLNEGVNGLKQLPGIADTLLTRRGACTSCTATASCSTCPVIVGQYRKANADNAFYCQWE